MIIGIMGKAGSGKDTTADFLKKEENFVKISLADPLKRICKDVFDFSLEQLWGPSERRNEPDKRYRREPHYHLISNPRTVDDPQYEEDRVCSSCSKSGPPPGGPGGQCFHYLTPRYALQQLGTEWGRNCYDNVWIDYALRLAKKAEEYAATETPYEYSPLLGLRTLGIVAYLPGRVVIPDCRFRNEFEAVKEAGGKMLRVIRPGAGLSGDAGTHKSETEQDSIEDDEFDEIIVNNGTLDDLYWQVKDMFRNLQQEGTT